jgi:hypothetical protein
MQDFIKSKNVAQQPLGDVKPQSPQITAKPIVPSPTKVVSPPQAQKEVSPTESGLKSRVFDRLKSEHSQLEGDVFYDPTTIKKETDKAVDLMVSDKQKAFDISMRKVSASEAESVATNIAMAEKALSEGNYKLYGKLITNRSIAQSMRGQAIAMEKASITDNSTSRYVKDLLDVRLKSVGKRYLTGLKRGDVSDNKHATEVVERKAVELERKIKNKKLDVKTALKLLDELECV